MASAVKRRSETDIAQEAPKEAKSDNISVMVLQTGSVVFDYQSKLAEISLAKLQEGSLYFAQLLSADGPHKAPCKFTLPPPDVDHFSPTLFIDLIRACNEPCKPNMEDLPGILTLMRSYQFNDRSKVRMIEAITYDNLDSLSLELYEQIAQVFDRQILAVHCCQLIVNQPNFIDRCFYDISTRTLKILTFFERVRQDITAVNLRVYRSLSNPPVMPLCTVGSKTLELTMGEDSSFKLVKLFTNLCWLNIELMDIGPGDPNENAGWDNLYYSLKTRSNILGDAINDHEAEFVYALKDIFFCFSKTIKFLRFHSLQAQKDNVIKIVGNKNGKFLIEFSLNKEDIHLFKLDREVTEDNFHELPYAHASIAEPLEPGLNPLFFEAMEPTLELLEGIDRSRLPFSEDGKVIPEWGTPAF